MICFGKQLVYNDKNKTRENCKDTSCPAFDIKANKCLFAKKENKNGRTTTGKRQKEMPYTLYLWA